MRGRAQIDGEETGALAGRIRGHRRIRSRGDALAGGGAGAAQLPEKEQGPRRGRSKGGALAERLVGRCPHREDLGKHTFRGRSRGGVLIGGGAWAACSQGEEVGRRAHRGRSISAFRR
jgi:hypothetical protein